MPGRPQTTHFIKRQAEFLQRAGVQVDVFHFRGAKNPAKYALAWLRVQPRLRAGRYHLVHAQFGQSGLLALPKRMPLVVTLRGSDLLGIVGEAGHNTRAGRLLNRLVRHVARRADAVIVVSEHMKAHFQTEAPIVVLPSGLDLERFAPVPREEARRRMALDPEKRLVLFAGDPDNPRKRYGLARQAVEVLNRTLPAELVVAWGVPHQDMPCLMSACDALVFTSMQEGSPNVVKEALACDLPVISVPVGDVAERLGGIAGCELCANERPETIAGALERVLRRRERVAGRDAIRHLDEALLTQRLIELYRSVISRNAGAGIRAVPRPESDPTTDTP
jgi:glycosyltransferase involved in cell wall biosynthesis